MDNLKQKVESIILSVGHGQTFDAHMVIDSILRQDTELYLQYYNGQKKVSTFHSQISKVIKSFEGTLIERAGKNVSENIHHKYTPCTCWRRK